MQVSINKFAPGLNGSVVEQHEGLINNETHKLGARHLFVNDPHTTKYEGAKNH